MILEARLAELDALLREAVARMRRPEDSAAAGPLALVLVGTLTDTVRELGETVGVLCWVLRRRGVSPEALMAARVEMLTEFAQQEAVGRDDAG